MLPFQVATMTAAKRITRSEIDVLEQLALEIFEAAYLGQYNRIGKAIQRAKPETLQQFLDEQWEEEPELVERSVRKWYDDTAEDVGLDTIETYGLDVKWAEVNDSLLETSAARASWFSRAMTETSIEQTQEVIGKWLETEGQTLGMLEDTLKGVWTGPRPLAAAITETTNIVAQSEIAVGLAEGAWGYDVHTMNDDRVRPHHTATAKGGPYPISDTEHLPPIMDDINCRCFITLVMEQPT